MMVLSSTLPGHSVPVHSHMHEQVGMVYSGKARLRIGAKNALLRREISIASQPTLPIATRALVMSRL